MTAFAAQEATHVREKAKQRQEPDEDGFVTVTRGGRTGPARQEIAQEQAEKQKEKQKGLEDFYRFQTRERRKARAGELVRKFEEDKERVKRMRERRGRFKVRSGVTLLFSFTDRLFSPNDVRVIIQLQIATFDGLPKYRSPLRNMLQLSCCDPASSCNRDITTL